MFLNMEKEKFLYAPLFALAPVSSALTLRQRVPQCNRRNFVNSFRFEIIFAHLYNTMLILILLDSQNNTLKCNGACVKFQAQI